MNPFHWLRKSIAQCVVTGFEDGLAQLERELGHGPLSKPQSAIAISQADEIDEVEDEQLPEITPLSAAPLAAFVQQLGINGTAPAPGLPPASGEVRRKPGRPRKHNHDPS